jgi:hypothetical protein
VLIDNISFDRLFSNKAQKVCGKVLDNQVVQASNDKEAGVPNDETTSVSIGCATKVIGT